ncbi:hypothetical protein [Frigoribacterium salinisoli]
MGIGVFLALLAAIFVVLGVLFVRKRTTGGLVGGIVLFVLATFVGHVAVALLVVGAILA